MSQWHESAETDRLLAHPAQQQQQRPPQSGEYESEEIAIPTLITETHADPYEKELGSGTPLYDEWIIEEDSATGSFSTIPIDRSRGFRTPRGFPSSNELWRFRRRGCQDCWAALFFFAVVGAVLLFGVAELWHLELTNGMILTIARNVGVNEKEVMPFLVNNSKSTMGKSRGRLRDSVKVTKEVGPRLFARKEEGGMYVTGGAAPPDIHVVKGLQALRTGISLVYYAFTGSNVGHESGYGAMFSLFIAFIVVAALALLGAMLGLIALQVLPRVLIRVECYMSSAFFAALALLAAYGGGGASGLPVLFLLGMAALPLVWLFLIRDRIPFTAALLSTSAVILRRHKGLIVVSLCLALTWMFYTMLSLLFCMPLMIRALALESWHTDAFFLCLVVFALFWVEQVTTNVMHVTASGVVATWYFASEKFMPPFPIKESFSRATWSSLGSISLGSLLVAIVSFIRWFVDLLAHSDEDGGGLFARIASYILSCIESLMQYFNEYAFVHVAIYGCSYTDGARRTWRLTRQCFFAAVFNSCLVNQALNILTFILAVVVGGVAWLTLGSGLMGLFAVPLTVFVCTTVYRVVQSTVTTIFVCFAELPEGLRISFPELYLELMQSDVGVSTVHGGPRRRVDAYGAVEAV